MWGTPKRYMLRLGMLGFLGPNFSLQELMSLRMEKLDHHLVAYVWASKTTMMGAQKTTLLGRALAPLQDFKLQRKTTTWGIFDILEGAWDVGQVLAGCWGWAWIGLCAHCCCFTWSTLCSIQIYHDIRTICIGLPPAACSIYSMGGFIHDVNSIQFWDFAVAASIIYNWTPY